MSNREDVVKKSLDIPEGLFEAVMGYAYKEKIYKFGPSVVELLSIALRHLEEEEKANGGN